MNYKQFIRKVENTNKAILIDKQENIKRGLNNVRILRFFFCSPRKELERIVNKNNAIGFYVVVEYLHFSKDYEVYIKLITREQTVSQDTLLFELSNSATKLYELALNKIKELI